MSTSPVRVRTPQQEWRELGLRRRWQVARHAWHGRHHPDAHVAAVARAWAEQVPQRARPVGRRQRIGRVAAAVLAIVLLIWEAFVVWGGSVASGTDPGLSDCRDRGLARRIPALPPA